MVSIDLTTMPSGLRPRGFTGALTGQGAAVRWQVLDDASAPHGGKVIAETSGDSTDYRFPICIYDDVTAKNVNVSVRFKPIAGRVDQGGGLIARVKNSDNYYVARSNALEDNVNLYKVVEGERRKIAGYKGKVSQGAGTCWPSRSRAIFSGWHSMESPYCRPAMAHSLALAKPANGAKRTV